MRIEKLTPEQILAVERRAKTREINEATAVPVIEEALHDAGFRFRLECQCFRVMVTVLIDDRSAMRFAIRYKEVLAGHTDEIVASVRSLADSIALQNREIRIWRGSHLSSRYGWR